jgi:hypothetical protein
VCRAAVDGRKWYEGYWKVSGATVPTKVRIGEGHRLLT